VCPGVDGIAAKAVHGHDARVRRGVSEPIKTKKATVNGFPGGTHSTMDEVVASCGTYTMDSAMARSESVRQAALSIVVFTRRAFRVELMATSVAKRHRSLRISGGFVRFYQLKKATRLSDYRSLDRLAGAARHSISLLNPPSPRCRLV
jgi:hypothetical protein